MTWHKFVAGIGFTLAVSLAPLAARAGILTVDTAFHPLPSTLTINFYLGGPPGSGVLIASTGPALVTGHGVISVDLDATDSGTATLESSELLLESYGPQTIDLGIAGTIDLRADQVRLTAAGDGTVLNNVVRTASNSYVDYSVYSGTISAFNPTGLIAALFGSGPQQIVEDFGVSPIMQHFSTGSGGFLLGTVDDGPGLYSPLPEFNFAYSFSTELLYSTPSLWAEVVADLHFAAVPEPSSLALAIGAMICLGLPLVRRQMRV